MGMNKAIGTGFICIIIGCIVIAGFTIFEAVNMCKLFISVEQEHREIGNIIPVTATDIQKLEEELFLLKKPDFPGREFPEGDTINPARYGTIPGISETAAVIRNLLAGRYIRPDRFRITGKEPEAQAEFQIRCSPLQFFGFLAETEEERTITISSVSIRLLTGTEKEMQKVSSEIDVTLKVKGKAFIFRNTEIPYHPFNSALVSKAFYMPRPSLPAHMTEPLKKNTGSESIFSGNTDSGDNDSNGSIDQEYTKTAAVVETDDNNGNIVHENKVIMLGIIRDADNTEYIYGKDIESGRIVTVKNSTVTPSFN
jgi:hypothetical protein